MNYWGSNFGRDGALCLYGWMLNREALIHNLSDGWGLLWSWWEWGGVGLPVQASWWGWDEEASLQASQHVVQHADVGGVPLFGVVGRPHGLGLEEGGVVSQDGGCCQQLFGQQRVIWMWNKGKVQAGVNTYGIVDDLCFDLSVCCWRSLLL